LKISLPFAPEKSYSRIDQPLTHSVEDGHLEWVPMNLDVRCSAELQGAQCQFRVGHEGRHGYLHLTTAGTQELVLWVAAHPSQHRPYTAATAASLPWLPGAAVPESRFEVAHD